MTNPADYQYAVATSRLLNEYQKEAFLDHPDEFPQDFKQNIVELLTGFDERSQAREKEYLKKIKELFAGYRTKLATLPGVSEEDRVRLLEEADRLETACFVEP